MLNQQIPEAPDRDITGVVQVHSIFRTIQGEGPYTGQAALFIRLAGCNLQCPGCDTDYTSKRLPFTPTELLAAMRDVYNWTREMMLMHYGTPQERPLVVITGGEPFRQNIVPFTRLLLNHGYRVQIESNGVLYPGDDFKELMEDFGDRLCLVVSPKTARIHPKTAQLASAYKYVLAATSVAGDGLPAVALYHVTGVQGNDRSGTPTPTPTDGTNGVVRAQGTVARPPVGWEGPVYLNPMDEQDEVRNRLNFMACVQSVMEHRRYIVGVQLHKQIGLP